MGTSLADIFGTPPEPRPKESLADIFDQPDNVPAGRLGASMRAARQFSPEQMAEAQTLSRRIGLSPSVIARNMEEVKAIAGDRTFDPGAFIREYPKAAEWLSYAENAALAQDDTQNLGEAERLLGRGTTLDRFLTGFGQIGQAPSRQQDFTQEPESVTAGILQRRMDKGTAILQRGNLGVMRMLGDESAETKRDADAMTKFLAEEIPEAQGFGRFVAGSAEILPSMVPGVALGLAGGILGGGAAVALGAGAAATAGAAGAGTFAGRYLSSFALEGGNAMLDFEELTDENGQKVSPAIARSAALGVGILAGGLNALSLGVVLKPFGDAGQMLLRGGMQRAMQQMTYRQALANGVKAWGTGVGSEIVTETAQQGVQLLAEQSVREWSNMLDDTALASIPGGRVTAELVETAIETAIGMTLLAGAGGAVRTTRDMQRIALAEADADAFGEAVGVAEASKLRARDPEKFREAIASMIPAEREKVGVEAERVMILLQEQNIPVQQFAQAAGVSARELQDAAASGQDILIPTANLLANFVGSKGFDQMFVALQPDLKMRPDGMSQREAAEMAKNLDADVAQVQKDMEAIVKDGAKDASGQRVIDDLVAQITAATATQNKSAQFTPENIEATARGIAAFYITRAEKLGRDAFDYYAERNYRILPREQGEPMFDLVQVINDKASTPEQIGEARRELNQLLGGVSATELRNARRMRQMQVVEDALGDGEQLRWKLSDVQTNPLVTEYIRRREALGERQGQLIALEESASDEAGDAAPSVLLTVEQSPTPEDAFGVLERAGFGSVFQGMDDAESFPAKMQAFNKGLRELRERITRDENGLNRIERELAKRGVEDVDAYAEANDLVGDDSFNFGGENAFDALTQAPPLTAEEIDQYYAAEAWRVKEQFPDASPADIADDIVASVSDVRRWLSQPKPELTPEQERSTMLRIAFLAQAAFHGSPYVFDRFDLSKIGTGEGAQAYGWGLYFAENQDVAQGYQNTLSRDNITVRGLPDDRYGLTEAQVNTRAKTIRSLLANGMESDARLLIDETPLGKVASDIIEGRAIVDSGALYRVDIPDDAVARMLDWDKPLSEQAPGVRKALSDAGFTKDIARKNLGDYDKGENIYQWFANTGGNVALSRADLMQGSPEAASQYFNSIGIPGIKYLDAGSRQPPTFRLVEVAAETPANENLAEAVRAIREANGGEVTYADIKWTQAAEAAEKAGYIERIGKNRKKGWTVTDKGRAAVSGGFAFTNTQSGVQGPTFATVEEARAWKDAEIAKSYETRNLVVFDDALVTITHRNGEPVTPQERADFLAQMPNVGTPAQVPTPATREEVEEFRKSVKAELGLEAFEVYPVTRDGLNDLSLETIIVPKSGRSSGVGTKAMERLIEFAEQHGSRIVLSAATPADKMGTTSKGRLVEFYKRFGFVENKGRNKDFALSKGMYRVPRLTPEMLAQSPTIPETIDIDGVQRPTRNSNGQPIHPTEQGVRNFWAWFAGSKVVDAEGRPLVVYHGTASDFNVFDSGLVGQNYGADDAGFFFTSDSWQGERWARGAARAKEVEWDGPAPQEIVVPAYLRLQNPWIINVNTDLNAGGKSPVEHFEGGDGQFDRGQRFIVEYAMESGYDGVIVRDDVVDSDHEAMFIALDNTSIKSVDNSGEFGPTANILRQGDARPNAFILPNVSQKTIALMNTANLSSLMHEFSHDWLVMMGQDAALPDAPQSIKDDYAVILKYLGVDSAEKIGEQEQEFFARTFERYLATADAPSRGLARAFVRMRSWMARVYRQVEALFIPVNPLVSDVFDRMLASDAEIAAVRGQNQTTPFTPEDAAKLGMTEARFGEYAEKVRLRDANERGALLAALLAEKSDEAKKIRREREAVIRAEVEQEVDARPVYQAIAQLTGDGPKLNLVVLESEYGADIKASLPRGVTTTEGGTDADTLALTYGFRDGFAVVEAMQQAPTRKAEVNRLVRERMALEFPDPMQDSAAMQAEAQKAVHRAETDDVLVDELKMLAKTAGIRPPSVQAVKQVARETIGRMVVKDIRPIAFQNAEATAARKSTEALRSGNVPKAEFHKRQQLLNHILYREAVRAQERQGVIERFAKRMMKQSTQERLGRAGLAYQTAMNTLLGSYGFIPMGEMGKGAALDAFVKEALEGSLAVPAIPESVLNREGVTSIKAIPMAELDGLYSTMQQVYQIAAQEDRALQDGEKRTITEMEADVTASIAERHELSPRTIDYYPLSLSNAKQKLAAIDAWHLPPEFLFVWLDGDTTGAAYNAFMKPFALAEADEFRRGEVAFKKMQEIEAMVDLPPVALDKSRQYRGIRSKMTKRAILALALNMGTKSGVEATLAAEVDGAKQFGSYADIQAMFAQTLTEADWRYIEAKWDYANTFWPEIAELERSTNGIIPQKLEAEPFPVRTADGRDILVKGGYYPLKYNTAKLGIGGALRDARVNIATDEMTIMGVGAARAQTQHGWTEERQKASGRPLDLNLNVWNAHIANVIHDLSHRKAVRDVVRLYQRKGMRQAIEQSAGQEAYNSLKPWLARIANPNQVFDNSPVENILANARAGVTVVNMGLSVGVAMIQPLGYLQSADVIGPKWLAQGIIAAYTPSAKSIIGAALGGAAYGSTLGPWGAVGGAVMGGFVGGLGKQTEMVMETSVAMRQRRDSFNRDIRDYTRTRGGKLNGFEQFYFSFIGMMDNAVMVPTWIGGYRRAMAENGGDHDAAVQFADSAVRRSQGAGSPKDLSRIQGGPELRRMLTIHYSFLSRQYGLFRRSATNYKEGRWGKARTLASLTTVVALSQILSELVAGRGPDEEDDENWLTWAAMETLRAAFSPIVFVRDIARAVGPDAYAYKLSPVVDALSKTVGALNTVLEFATEGEDFELSDAEAKEFIEAVGYWGKLPTRAVWRAVTAFQRWQDGYDVPAADFIRTPSR